jgi:cytochrome c-type biogenesis protein CcmH
MLGLSIWFLPVLVFVLFAIRQRAQRTTELDSSIGSIQIHKERLKALSLQFDAGELSEEEYESFKAEEEKALLADTETSRDNEEQETQMSWYWVPVLSASAFVVAGLVYLNIGSLDAVNVRDQFKQLSMSSTLDPNQVSETLGSYKELLETTPEDIEGWFRLSRMQLDLEQFEESVYSLNHVLAEIRKIEHNAEDEATILTYIGQAEVALASPEKALAAFEESLEYYQTPTALGMAGRMSFDLGDYQKAIEYWTQLKLNNQQADSTVIDDFIDKAKAQLAAQGIDYEEELPTRIIVNISLPAAYEGLAKEAALFIYARPVGQKMPLAVKRLPITAQTVSVMLSDADAMGPMGGISTQDVVEVTARISLTGLANTQPGDWGGDVVEVEINDKENFVDISIEQP